MASGGGKVGGERKGKEEARIWIYSRAEIVCTNFKHWKWGEIFFGRCIKLVEEDGLVCLFGPEGDGKVGAILA